MSLPHIFLIIISLGYFSPMIFSQCSELSFEEGYGNWNGQLGINQGFGIQWQSNNISPTRHTRITETTIDTNTCGNLVINPDELGGTVVRLGNANAGSQAEAMHVQINPSISDLIIVRYAIVMEDPSHTPINQPFFQIKIQDKEGEILDSVCSFYRVISDGSIPGFDSCGLVRWKDWSALALDISKYNVDDVVIRIEVADCAEGKHFGYAYFNVECANIPTQVFACNTQDSIEIEAPIGFDQYQWSNGLTDRKIKIKNPFTNTTIGLTATASTSCEIQRTIQINTSNAPAIGYSQTEVSCENQCNGTIQLESISGRSPFQFNWSNGLPSTQNQNNLCPGEYGLTVVDAVGCFILDSFLIAVPNSTGITLSTTIESPDCHNGQNGSISVSATKSTQSDQVIFEWQDNPNATLNRGNLFPGDYILNTTNLSKNACRIDTFTVPNIPMLTANVFINPSNCLEDNDAFAQVKEVYGTEGEATLIWNFDTIGYQPFQIKGLNTYVLRIIDEKGCIQDSLFENEIIPDVFINLPDTIFKTKNTSINLTAAVNSNSQFYSTRWYPVSSYTQLSPEQIAITSDTTSKIIFELTKLNDGCQFYDSTTVLLVNTDVDFLLPTIFSPNADGQNDIWKPIIFNTGKEIVINHFRIFNRWGALIYDSKLPEWNGYDSSGKLAPIATYLVEIEAKVDGISQVMRRQLTLIR